VAFPTDVPAFNSTSSLNASAPFEQVHLNAASFWSPSALFIDIHTENIQNICTLIDSGSSDCFIDSRFTLANNFHLKNLPIPLCLSLFDGSASANRLIIQFTTQKIHLPCGAQQPVHFLLTTLDHSASAVLGYSWLHRYNLLIDWVMHNITFWTKEDGSMSVEPPSLTIPCAPHELSVSLLNPATAGSPTASLPPDLPPSAELHTATASIPVSFIRASALAFLSHLPSSHPQLIVLSGVIEPDTSSTFATSTAPTSHHEDDTLAAEFDSLRPQIPRDYHDYLNVFSKQKGTTLPPQ
jgi:hypothetical protein